MKRNKSLKYLLLVLFTIGIEMFFAGIQINSIKGVGDVKKEEDTKGMVTENSENEGVEKKIYRKEKNKTGAEDTTKEIVNTTKSEPLVSDTDMVQPVEAASSQKENSEENTSSAKQGTNYSTTEVLVKFKPDKVESTEHSSRTFLGAKSLNLTEYIESAEIAVVEVPESSTVEELINELTNDSNIEAVQPNYKYYPATISTNDTYKDLLWGLDNTGQTVNGPYGNITGTADADIDAPEAWEIYEGGDTIVAIIDTGVAYDHPDLNANMWDGNTCVDDNNNPLGGCIHGYDYEDNDLDPVPTVCSHGTHIAGTIGAIKNNNQGIIGVSPNVKIMGIKIPFPLPTSEAIKAINFAKNNGAKVINASWSGPSYDSLMRDAISDFSGLFIAAASNDGTNNDSYAYYPCSYNLDNIICVAATDQNDDLASFSNYGATTVDIGAPGTNIYSTGWEQEIFSDASVPLFTGTKFTKTSGNWLTSTWDGTDKMAMANTSYVNNDDAILTLTNPVDSSVIPGNVYLKFYLLAEIEDETGCPYDYLSFETDNNDDNWVEQARGCESFDGMYYVDLGTGSPTMRIRIVWHTNDTVTGTQVPIIDDITISNTHSYQYMNGTSMATPHVVGAAALIWGYDPSLTATEVKTAILDNGDSVASLSGKTVTGKRLNIAESLYGPFCTTNGGYWLQDHNECGNISSTVCTSNGGVFNSCASACRHKGPNVYCVLHCIEICTF